MFDLFFEGSPLFMGILTLLLLVIIVLAIGAFINGQDNEPNRIKSVEFIKSLGLLACIIGMLAFLIGMFAGLSVIEIAGDISPAVLAGGLKVGLITPIYGLIIYGVAQLGSLILHRS